MRELMEEEELFCLEEENNTTNNTTTTTTTMLLKEEEEEEQAEAEDMWAGGCRGGVKKRKDHVLVEGKNENARNASSFKRAKRYPTPFHGGRRRRFRSRRQNPRALSSAEMRNKSPR